MGQHFGHDIGPGPRAHLRVMRGQVGASNSQIDGGQAVGFVFAVKELFRDGAVLRFQASLLGRLLILPIENSIGTLVEPVLVEHVISPVVGDITTQTLPLPSSRRAGPSWYEY